MTPKELARKDAETLSKILTSLVHDCRLSPDTPAISELRLLAFQKAKEGAPILLSSSLHYSIFKDLTDSQGRSANAIICSHNRGRQHYLEASRKYGSALSWFTRVTNPELYQRDGDSPDTLSGWLDSKVGANALENLAAVFAIVAPEIDLNSKNEIA